MSILIHHFVYWFQGFLFPILVRKTGEQNENLEKFMTHFEEACKSGLGLYALSATILNGSNKVDIRDGYRTSIAIR